MTQARGLTGVYDEQLVVAGGRADGAAATVLPEESWQTGVDDRPVLSGMILVSRNGLRWCDAPPEYGPPKTLHNRWIRWSRMGVFARTMEGLASGGGEGKVAMIDATCLKAQRTASKLGVKKGNPTTNADV